MAQEKSDAFIFIMHRVCVCVSVCRQHWWRRAKPLLSRKFFKTSALRWVTGGWEWGVMRGYVIFGF